MKGREQHVGTHLVHIEGDILRFQWVGDVEAQDMTEVHGYLEGMLSGYERVYMLVDASAGRSVTVEARKRAVTWPHAQRLAGAAIFGTRITTRAAATILTTVVNFFDPKAAIALEFATTEADARAWIDTHRRRITPREPQAMG